MAQQLRVLAVLAEDRSSVPSTSTSVASHNCNSRFGGLTHSLALAYTWYTHINSSKIPNIEQII